MKSSALGMIETFGYIGAIAGADAAVKAALVEIKGLEMVKGGIVTVLFTGDVGAVYAAVEAGAAEASRVGTLRTSHVIARVSDELEFVFEKEKEMSLVQEPKAEESTVAIEETKAPEVELEIACEPLLEETEVIEVAEVLEVIETSNDTTRRSREALVEMKVMALRNIARNIENIQIDRKHIKFSNKAELINAILASYDRR